MLKKNKLFRIALVLIAFGIISGFGTYLYVFHKPHRNIAKEKPSYILIDQELYDEFNANEEMAYQKYGNKVIQLKGKVVEFSKTDSTANAILLDEFSGISCSFDYSNIDQSKLSNIETGSDITLKGKVDGFDMIMGVVLTRCVPI